MLLAQFFVFRAQWLVSAYDNWNAAPALNELAAGILLDKVVAIHLRTFPATIPAIAVRLVVSAVVSGTNLRSEFYNSLPTNFP